VGWGAVRAVGATMVRPGEGAGAWRALLLLLPGPLLLLPLLPRPLLLLPMLPLLLLPLLPLLLLTAANC
jgi:hypothetical protein